MGISIVKDPKMTHIDAEDGKHTEWKDDTCTEMAASQHPTSIRSWELSAVLQQESKSGAVGIITDHLNGTYTATFRLLWEGENTSAVCNYSDPHAGGWWYCEKPANIPCNTPGYHALRSYGQNLLKQEEENLFGRLLVQPSALQSSSMEVARAALRDTPAELCAKTSQFVGWRHGFSFL
ncbi:Neurexophilin [Branchiostoma belcheri]|nr:Neurexophilin [Branchiostoma belcheri]